MIRLSKYLVGFEHQVCFDDAEVSFQPRDRSWVSDIASKQVLYCMSQGSVSALGEPSSVVIQLGLLFKLYFWASLIAQLVKNPPAMQETLV